MPVLYGTIKGHTIYHGSCLSCKTPSVRGQDVCVRCQYHDAIWSKPNLKTDRHLRSKQELATVKARYGFSLLKASGAAIGMASESSKQKAERLPALRTQKPAEQICDYCQSGIIADWRECPCGATKL